MVGSRASRLGWVGAVLLGQKLGWAFGESTCTSITVSGVGDYDGTYDMIYDEFYRRPGGTTQYFLSGASASWWYLYGSSPKYKTFDDARHPADITLEWAECTSSSDCDAGAASLQPVITCEGEATEPPSSAGAAGSPSTPSPETSVEWVTAAPTPSVDVSQGEADGEGLSVGGIAGMLLGIIVVEIIVVL